MRKRNIFRTMTVIGSLGMGHVAGRTSKRSKMETGEGVVKVCYMLVQGSIWYGVPVPVSEDGGVSLCLMRCDEHFAFL